MKEYSFYKEKSFFIIFFISVYINVMISLILSKVLPNASIFIYYAVPQAIYIATTIIYSKVQKVNILKAMPIDFKMQPSRYIWVFVATVSIFCFSLLPNFLIITLLRKMGLQLAVSVPRLDSAVNIILAILIICIMPAIGEEMVFRGVLNSAFRELGGVTVILLSGLMFSLSHFNMAQTIYQFFLGVLLSYLYLKTHNLLIPIIIHALNNMVALFIPLIIPFFGALHFQGITFGILIPMCLVGGFVAVIAIRQLVDDTLKGKTVTVFEYNPTQNDFVAIATEQATEKKKTGILAKVGYKIEQNIKAILSIFNKHERKEKINRFKELYPKTKNVDIVIKILILAIIGLWLISVLV